jgi:hypothetical protein
MEVRTRKRLVLTIPDGHAHTAKLVLDGVDISDMVRGVVVTVSVAGEATAIVELVHLDIEVDGEMVVDLLPDDLKDIESDE